jgi:SAM-dependent methyltransferase
VKLAHDIENDLEHTIPAEGGWETRWLFDAMTKRSLALLEAEPTARILDQACGMGQDTLALAGRMARSASSVSRQGGPGKAYGLEPSNRMIRYAQGCARDEAPNAGNRPLFVRALAEEMPFRGGTFDALLCKGAMDHFMDPAKTMEEIARVLKPGGRAVLAIANYDSLSCRLGRLLDRVIGMTGAGRPPTEHPYYEPPPDHMTRFGYRSILALPGHPLVMRRVEGLSLLWGFPPWARLVALAPSRMRPGLRRAAFSLGRIVPGWADVIVLQVVKAGPVPAEAGGWRTQ